MQPLAAVLLAQVETTVQAVLLPRTTRAHEHYACEVLAVLLPGLPRLVASASMERWNPACWHETAWTQPRKVSKQKELTHACVPVDAAR